MTATPGINPAEAQRPVDTTRLEALLTKRGFKPFQQADTLFVLLRVMDLPFEVGLWVYVEGRHMVIRVDSDRPVRQHRRWLERVNYWNSATLGPKAYLETGEETSARLVTENVVDTGVLGGDEALEVVIDSAVTDAISFFRWFSEGGPDLVSAPSDESDEGG